MFGWGDGRDNSWRKSSLIWICTNLLNSCSPKWDGVRFSVCLCVCVSGCHRCLYMYIKSMHVSQPLPFPLPLAVGDCCAAAQFYNHLLAVVEGPLVSQLLQGAGSISQHAHPLARSRKEGRRKVAARQHHGLRLFPLAGPRLALLCRQEKK